ncbi:hypothetical protein [Glutamicibacter arilaitensis]|uniref:MFS transporter n=1 Tax=Glutamicibacter arilaitensis TaxID=256701 RepID=A0A4Y8TUS7_9MICC|nr:hypothetical protein [Glutamicibacter arilaitensis]TFH55945.1 hypothetical protein EXY26_02425 [Glutamicibacter arilaitensis]
MGYGISLGLASAQLTGTVLQLVPEVISGQRSATQSTVRQIGLAMGPAVSGAVLSVSLVMTLPAQLESQGMVGQQAAKLAEATPQSAGTNINQLYMQADSANTIDAFNAGIAQATQISTMVAAAFLLLGAMRVWQLRMCKQPVREQRPMLPGTNN